MQMTLPSILRRILLCFFAQALLAPGFSLQSFLSYRSLLRGIPETQRVTTVFNLDHGLGVVRPTTTVAPAEADAATSSAAGDASTASSASDGSAVSSSSSVGARMWKIDAVFEMVTTSPLFTDEYANSHEGVALTLADRLQWVTGVPMSRFAFWMPAPGASDATNCIFCESLNNEHRVGGLAARFASAKNTTYTCEPQKRKMNSTTPVLLQQSNAAKASSLSIEVGVYPASGVSGDTTPAVQVAEQVVDIANGDDEPVRTLLKTGLWSYEAGPGVKLHGLLPGTALSMPGAAVAQRDTSMPLGPNPGGHGAEPPPTAPPTDKGPPDANGRGANGIRPPKVGEKYKKAELEDKDRSIYFQHVDTVIHEANKINTGVSNSLQELKDSLARASAVHSAWMNWNPYKPPSELVGP